MALVKVKPTSPGRRGMVKVVTPDLYKGRPFAALIESQSKSAGRNNNGHITTRHIGGGHKQHYRMIDFKRTKDGIPAKVERIEYDPNRTANIALLCYADAKLRAVPRRRWPGPALWRQAGVSSAVGIEIVQLGRRHAPAGERGWLHSSQHAVGQRRHVERAGCLGCRCLYEQP